MQNNGPSTAQIKTFLSNNNGIDSNNNEESIEQTQSLVGGQLKDYQKIGLRWMVSLNNLRLNGILADEMGLGKTVQVISLFAYLLDMQNVRGLHLIVAPTSTLDGWMHHLQTWCPKLKAVCFHGADRHERLERIFEGEEECDVLVTSDHLAVRDGDELRKVKWCYLVIDEAHRIKNRESRLFGVLNDLSTKHRLLLTGTPLQNNLTELWSLLNFILPEVFDSAQSFESWFCTPFGSTGNGKAKKTLKMTDNERLLVIERLHRAIDPFLLRRNKADVLPDLVKKEEIVLTIPLSGMQMSMYQQIAEHGGIYYKRDYKPPIDIDDNEDNKDGSDNINGGNNDDDDDDIDVDKRFRINKFSNQLMALRRVCSHPLLFYNYEYEINEENIICISGKFCLLDHLIPKLLKFNHRILLFCQFVISMDILAEYCNLRELNYERIDGGTSKEDRIAALNDFNNIDVNNNNNSNDNSKESSTASNSSNSTNSNNSGNGDNNSGRKPANIFLMSTRACGVGINAQTADTVIMFDSDWNPQMDVQAQARAHRIGQTREVRVFRLISEQSIEEMIFNRGQQKLDLEKKAIEGGKFDFSLNSEEKKVFLQKICKQKLNCDQSYFTVANGDENRRNINKLIARSDEEEKMFNKMDKISNNMKHNNINNNEKNKNKDKAEIDEDNETLDWSFAELMTCNELPEWLEDYGKILKEKENYEKEMMKSGKRRRRKATIKNKENDKEYEKLYKELDKDLEREDAKNKRLKRKGNNNNNSNNNKKGKNNKKKKNDDEDWNGSASVSKKSSRASSKNTSKNSSKENSPKDDCKSNSSSKCNSINSKGNNKGKRGKKRKLSECDENMENEKLSNDNDRGNDKENVNKTVNNIDKNEDNLEEEDIDIVTDDDNNKSTGNNNDNKNIDKIVNDNSEERPRKRRRIRKK